MIRRPPRSTPFPTDALPISDSVGCGDERRLTEHAGGSAGGTVRSGQLCAPLRTRGGNVDEEHIAADRKSTRLNSSHQIISYAVFCLKKKKYEGSDIGW